jgi:hypothetical protein
MRTFTAETFNRQAREGRFEVVWQPNQFGFADVKFPSKKAAQTVRVTGWTEAAGA